MRETLGRKGGPLDSTLESYLADLSPEALPKFEGPVPSESLLEATKPLIKALGIKKILEIPGWSSGRTDQLDYEISGAAQLLDTIAPLSTTLIELNPENYEPYAEEEWVHEKIDWSDWISYQAHLLKTFEEEARKAI